MYKLLIRPILFRFSPERAHNMTLRMLRFFRRIPLLPGLIRLFYKYESPTLKRNVMGLDFPNPVGLAAGIDKNGDYYNELAWFGFSFVVIGSLTLEPQEGNPRPRLFRLPQDKALINRMGINNKGVFHAIERIKADTPKTILCASIAKNSTSVADEDIISDYKTAFSRLYDFVDMFTVNVSCPNVVGLQGLQDVSYLSDVVDPLLDLRVCYDTYKPLLVKVSPDIPLEELDEILDYCMLSGVDGIVAGNTTTSREGLSTNQARLDKIGKGGLSGAPLFERSLNLVRHIHEYTRDRLTIIGVGGIMTPEQAKQMLDAGASLVEICTGFIYEGPSAVKKILKGLK
jgi:dihydroorotate dehydrogenase